MRWPMVCWLVFAAAATTNWADDKIEHFTLGLKYTINKHFAAHADYEYTNQSSFGGASGYSRNRYIAGLTYTY